MLLFVYLFCFCDCLLLGFFGWEEFRGVGWGGGLLFLKNLFKIDF